jgi:GDP-4-dehydro-6-deoxy-D-mannose reductase
MRVLVTGITGFVGSHLAEFCLSRGCDVFGTKHWRSSMENIRAIAGECHLIDCDLRDEGSTQLAVETSRPDRIFHLAAQSYVPTSYTAPRDTLETNIIGTLNVLEVVRKSAFQPLVHICSSSEVYGQVFENELPITESQPLRPQSPYAVSKVGADLLSWQYFKSYGIKTIRTRAFTHGAETRPRVRRIGLRQTDC